MRRHAAAAPRTRGFTLIELMIGVALLGTLMAIGLPSLTQWIRNSQVRTVTDGLQNGIRLAQSEAVRRNRTVVLSLTNSQPAQDVAAVANGKFWGIQYIAQFGEVSTNRFVQGGALTEVASNVTITGPAAICFNSNGRLAAVGSTGTGVSAACTVTDSVFNVALTGADRPLRVTVGLAGQLRLCDPNRPARSDASPDGC